MPAPPVSPVRIARSRLGEDGTVDLIAVELAARGTRPVELTETEQTAAALLMLERGEPRALVAYRLRLGASTVRRIAAAARLARGACDVSPDLPEAA